MQTYLNTLFLKFSEVLAKDLQQCTHQQTYTTKHQRREEALSFILEQISFDEKFVQKQRIIDMLTFVEEFRKNVKSKSATATLDRLDKRLREYLDRKEVQYPDMINCVGCGEMIERGSSHECINEHANRRNSAMVRDDTVKEIS